MIRRGALLMLVLALAACGRADERAPFTDSRIPPSLGPAFWPPQGWAWGLIQTGAAPAQRYGVGAPADQQPLAQALFLPGYGGLAEEVFPTANAMIDRRIQVWTLDGVGQGGSGRIAAVRDVGHVDSFEDDVAGLRRLAAEVIRPHEGPPLVAIADGTAAPVLLRALQDGAPGMAAAVLTGPRLSSPPHAPLQPRSAATAPIARWLGLDRRRAPGGSGWRREPVPPPPPGSPAFARQAWQLANPDLRMGGPSLGWLAAFDQLAAAVRAAGWKSLDLPVLILDDPAAPEAERAADARLCRALPHCALALESPDQWPQSETQFVETVAHAGDNPLETRGLPIPGHGR